MTSAPSSYELPRHPRVMWSRIKYRWPFLVWLAAIGVVGYLYLDSGRTVAVSGVIEVVREEASPLETARLAEVYVRPGQQVVPGEPLARFDSAVLDAERAKMQAELAVDQIQMDRQFSRNVLDAETRLREVKFQKSLDENKLAVLNEQLKGLDQVMNFAVEDAARLAFYRAEARSLEQAIKLYPASIQALEEDVEKARQQMASAQDWSSGVTTNAAGATQDIWASFRLREDQYTLRARNTGTVSVVAQAPGDTVKEGTPVVVSVISGTQHIIGFVPESMAHRISVGDTALITRPMQSTETFPARVTVLGPEILALPNRVSPVPGQTIRGRRIVLVVDAENSFLPGESVDIHLNLPWWMKRYQKVLKEYTAKN